MTGATEAQSSANESNFVLVISNPFGSFFNPNKDWKLMGRMMFRFCFRNIFRLFPGSSSAKKGFGVCARGIKRDRSC
jgi:hypothetical protein